jgi:phosphate starvation-inducible PhoH-like protein
MGKRAKRANRPNPREERNMNHKDQNQNLIHLNAYRKPRKRKVELIPRNVQQENYLELLENEEKDIVVATGPAGSGKTLMATLYAIKQLHEGHVEKIVITRPNVAVDDKDIGYLPGDIMAKMTPWMLPILDIFEEYYTPQEVHQLIEEKIIEICPIAYIRGRTFKNAIVLLDEAQGTTPNSMKSILTRIGDNTRMLVTGDMNQSDHGSQNGLSDFLSRYKVTPSIGLVQFTRKDVERSKVVRDVLSIYGED